jgi:DNA-binding NtrC family response regulator
MAALPTELIASELFGHVKGSFTGASETTEGRFAEAEAGTLFLDEITSMDERVQVALLRVLETRHYRRVGGTGDIPTDVRVIAAANMDPGKAVREGLFRADLLHRLQVLRITLPLLRKRPGDVPVLARYFLEQFKEKFESEVSGISPESIRLMEHYEWPGNVRELKNVIAQAVVMAEKGAIEPAHLPSRIAHAEKRTRGKEVVSAGEAAQSPQVGEAVTVEDPGQRTGLFLPLGMPLREVEKAYVLKSLAMCGHNKARTARMLEISRKALYGKLRRWRKNGGRPG